MEQYISSIKGELTINENMPSVIGDQTLLSQVFTNILENAFKYHTPETTPKVSINIHRSWKKCAGQSY